VSVIDNLVTGFRWAVPDGVTFYEGDIVDADLLARIIAEQSIGAIMHFAGSIVVPESVADPLKYYGNNTAKSRALIEAAVTGGVRHSSFPPRPRPMGRPRRCRCARTCRPCRSTRTAGPS
jgi:UDP-glucose 4-epimerase